MENIIVNVKDFILAGKALFTITNERTNKHFTYKVTKSKDNVKMYFVSVCSGYDEYQYIACLYVGNKITLTKSKRIKNDPQSIQVFQFITDYYINRSDVYYDFVKFYHEGKCCRCCRQLTTPNSIKHGIGPKCATM